MSEDKRENQRYWHEDENGNELGDGIYFTKPAKGTPKYNLKKMEKYIQENNIEIKDNTIPQEIADMFIIGYEE